MLETKKKKELINIIYELGVYDVDYNVEELPPQELPPQELPQESPQELPPPIEDHLTIENFKTIEDVNTLSREDIFKLKSNVLRKIASILNIDGRSRMGKADIQLELLKHFGYRLPKNYSKPTRSKTRSQTRSQSK